MSNLSQSDAILIMASAIFILGMVSFLMGVLVLVSRALGRNVQDIAQQTNSMVRKGMAEDVPGLVGNATALLNTLQSLVKTARGIGIFLIIIGIAMFGATYWLMLQVTWPIT